MRVKKAVFVTEFAPIFRASSRVEPTGMILARKSVMGLSLDSLFRFRKRIRTGIRESSSLKQSSNKERQSFFIDVVFPAPGFPKIIQ